MSGQDILQEPRQAVFRVTENGESMYFSVPESVELLQAAAHLRNYLSDENAGTKFTAIFPHGEKITQEQFDAAAAERMENTGCIAGAYELEITLYGSGIEDQSLTYHLNAAEKEVLREKMEAYCMQREHKPLDQLCQEILQEQDVPIQEMQM